MKPLLALACLFALAAPARAGVREDDANVDQVIFNPTAETHPAHTLYVNDYEVFVAQAGYAVTDSLQLSLIGGALAMAQDIALAAGFVGINAKLNLLRRGRFRLALGGTAGAGAAGAAFIGRVGMAAATLAGGMAAADFCLTADCHSRFSASGQAYTLGLDGGGAVVLRPAVSLAVRVSSHVKLLGEMSGVLRGGASVTTWATPSIGVRAFFRFFAADLAFARLQVQTDPLTGDSTSFWFPLFNLTVRT